MNKNKFRPKLLLLCILVLILLFLIGSLGQAQAQEEKHPFQEIFQNFEIISKKEFFEKKANLLEGEKIVAYNVEDNRFRLAKKINGEIWIIVWPKDDNKIEVSILSEYTLIGTRRYSVLNGGEPSKTKILKDMSLKNILEKFIHF